ncbi:hypothetical protein ACR71G_17580 [Xenorhabdus bovienii]|uniref:hypothetical protein n=1 Tax=Xenorhabdus bovienii TaxID=40576 RepID=UPI003DA38FF2
MLLFKLQMRLVKMGIGLKSSTLLWVVLFSLYDQLRAGLTNIRLMWMLQVA